MSALEIKNDLLSQLALVNDESVLLQIRNYIADLLKEKDWWDELPEAQKKRLLEARNSIRTPKGRIPHEEVIKEMEE